MFRPSVNALVVRDGSLLLVREPGKTWELPGGGIDPCEHIANALVREGEEETGYTLTQIEEGPITILENLFWSEKRGRFLQTMHLVYRAETTGEQDLGKVIEEEIEEIAWVPIDSLTEQNSHHLFWDFYQRLQGGEFI